MLPNRFAKVLLVGFSFAAFVSGIIPVLLWEAPDTMTVAMWLIGVALGLGCLYALSLWAYTAWFLRRERAKFIASAKAARERTATAKQSRLQAWDSWIASGGMRREADLAAIKAARRD